MAHMDADIDDDIDDEIMRMVLEESLNHTNSNDNDNEFNFALQESLKSVYEFGSTDEKPEKNYDSIIQSNDDFLRSSISCLEQLKQNNNTENKNIESSQISEKKEKQCVPPENNIDVNHTDILTQQQLSYEKMRELRIKYFTVLK